MKRYFMILLLIVFLIPFVVFADTCDTSKVTIDSIEIDDKTDSVVEYEAAVVEGNKIKLNIGMESLGDNIIYKMVIRNGAEEDFELDEINLDSNSEYIDYSIETDDDSYVIKAGTSKTVYLKVNYKKQVPADAFENGEYNASGDVVVDLSNDNNTISNPKTGRAIIGIIVGLIVMSLLFYLLRRSEIAKIMVLIIGIAFIAPLSVYAICMCRFNVNSNVKISAGTHFCLNGEEKMFFEYSRGETLKSYFINIIENIDDYEEYTTERRTSTVSGYYLYRNGHNILEYYLDDDDNITSFSVYPNTFGYVDDVPTNYNLFEQPIISSNYGWYGWNWVA